MLKIDSGKGEPVDGKGEPRRSVVCAEAGRHGEWVCYRSVANHLHGLETEFSLQQDKNKM